MPSTCLTSLHSLVLTTFHTDLQEVGSVANHQRSAKPIRGKRAQTVSRAKESVVWPHDGFLSQQNNDDSCRQVGSQQATWGHDGWTDLQKEGIGTDGQRGRDRRQRGEHAGGQAQCNSSSQQYMGGQEKPRGGRWRYRGHQSNNRAPKNGSISRNDQDGSRQTEFNESGRIVEIVHKH